MKKTHWNHRQTKVTQRSFANFIYMVVSARYPEKGSIAYLDNSAVSWPFTFDIYRLNMRMSSFLFSLRSTTTTTKKHNKKMTREMWNGLSEKLTESPAWYMIISFFFSLFLFRCFFFARLVCAFLVSSSLLPMKKNQWSFHWLDFIVDSVGSPKHLIHRSIWKINPFFFVLLFVAN